MLKVFASLKRQRALRRAAGLLLLAALAGSLGANFYVGRQAAQDYRSLYAERLDPLGADFYAAERAQPPAETGEPRVLFYGDSRAWQWPAPEGLPGVQFVNRGVPNQTTAQVLARWALDGAPLAPDVVVVQAGINDLKTLPLFPAQASAISADCLANLQALVTLAASGGARVIVATIFPTGPVPLTRRPFWSDDVPAAVRAVNVQLAALAGPQVTLLDAYTLLADGDTLAADYALDTLHLTPAGYAALNEALGPLLSEQLALGD
jgi:lysophospholipase L1-like esterase